MYDCGLSDFFSGFFFLGGGGWGRGYGQSMLFHSFSAMQTIRLGENGTFPRKNFLTAPKQNLLVSHVPS